MNRKTIALGILILVSAACKNPNKHDAMDATDSIATNPDTLTKTISAESEFIQLPDYSLKENIKMPDSINYFVLSNQAQFDSLFVPRKTADNKIKFPDFTRNIVVAVMYAATPAKTDIRLLKSTLNEGSLELRFNVDRGENQSVTSTPLYLISIPRVSGEKEVKFFVNDQWVKTSPLP